MDVSLILANLVATHPKLMILITVVGTARLVFKPIISGIDAVVAATPTKADDEVVEKAKSSKVFKVIAAVMNYLLSLKLPGEK